MRSVKTGAFAVAFATLSVLGAGMANAEPIAVTEEIFDCALQAELTDATLTELHVAIGTEVELSAEAAAELGETGCV
ncbi:hypothetical protein [Nocardia sp. SSK8]|uniref:hypothetical protein n=1 Tax=Nocardia sp. SSK8 TaxID=3120154 RepID=UPI00300BF843